MIKMLKTATLASLGLLLLVPGPAAAQEQLADVENLGDTLVFHPLVEFAQLSGCQECWCVDVVRRDEEVASNAVFLDWWDAGEIAWTYVAALVTAIVQMLY